MSRKAGLEWYALSIAGVHNKAGGAARRTKNICKTVVGNRKQRGDDGRSSLVGVLVLSHLTQTPFLTTHRLGNDNDSDELSSNTQHAGLAYLPTPTSPSSCFAPAAASSSTLVLLLPRAACLPPPPPRHRLVPDVRTGQPIDANLYGDRPGQPQEVRVSFSSFYSIPLLPPLLPPSLPARA